MANTMVSRSELHAFVLALATLNALSERILESIGKLGLAGSAFDLFGISAIFWFALFALAGIARQDTAREPPSKADWAVAGAIALAALIPVFAAAALALFAGSAWLLLAWAGNGAVRRLAVIGLGLCAPLIWGPLLLRLLGEQFLFADAWFVSWLTGLEHSGNLVLNPETGIEVAIYHGCSSVRNISQAVLLVAVVTQLFEIRLDRRVIVTTAVAAAGMILVNGLRLSLIGIYPQYYETLHTGMGNVALSWLSLVVLMVIVGVGLSRAPRHSS